MLLQSTPVIVTLVDRPSDQTNFADVIVGAFGIAGALTLLAVGLGVVMAVGLVAWHRLHRPEHDHTPPLTS